ncbi:MAG: D-alanine--poly(phosphoribitol) ligase subunit DltA [Eggerthellaceae bacterium]|nr:D-alanine--poly(phosphoribitol) ligase subunit DltA [Eggerthellaceae bacterium]
MASRLQAAIDAQAQRVPQKTAFYNSRGESITYSELKRQSDALAHWIAKNDSITPKTPLVVYGHKSPLMLVCFMACVKSGHAYVPVDVVYPRDRVASIIGQLGPTVVLDTIGTIPQLLEDALERPCFDVTELQAELADELCAAQDATLEGVGENDLFYILFTSGSTGTPKGVQITTECVDNFSKWLMDSEFAVDEERIWFNRSPFTFDVSLTDMAAGLTRGDTLFALEDEADKSLALAFEALGTSDATEWVSTPSFVDQCLADESFDAQLMPNLKRMLLAGEVLRPETVRLAQKRFPGLRVFNGYGPTESTDLVTLCEITPEMLSADRALPIGYAKPDSQLLVLDPVSLEPLPDGEHGELFVVGNTVATGYWQRDDLTQAAFGCCPQQLAGQSRSYRTGDEVTREPDGLYYYHGRYDLQIKLHGYRIELGDIESALCALPEVHMACVLPSMRDGAISHLVALLVLADPNEKAGFALTKRLKAALRTTIPSYMVPRAFKYVDAFPLNPSGKADRKALAALITD